MSDEEEGMGSSRDHALTDCSALEAFNLSLGWVVVRSDGEPYYWTFSGARKDACQAAVDGFQPDKCRTWATLRKTYGLSVSKATLRSPATKG